MEASIFLARFPDPTPKARDCCFRNSGLEMVAGPAAAQGSTFTKLSKEKRGRGRGPQASQALLTSRIARDRRPQELDLLSAVSQGFGFFFDRVFVANHALCCFPCQGTFWKFWKIEFSY